MKTRRQARMPMAFYLGVFLCLSLGLYFQTGVAQAAVADHLVVNELQVEGASGSGGVDDDWVELYNPTAAAIDLTGWSVQKAAGSGGSIFRQALSGSVPAHGYFLIVRDGASTTPALKTSADLLASDSFSLANNNLVFLVNTLTTVVPSALDAHVIDYVGIGTATYHEGASSSPALSAGKSIARVPEGEDTNNNGLDFVLQSSPTPQGTKTLGSNNLGGNVLLTINPDPTPVQNIASTGVDLVFQLNGAGNAKINYGLTNTYGSSTALTAVLENTNKTISLSGLSCNKTYHYSIYAENTGKTETDLTEDATFTTLPCGISLNSLTMTKQSAKANNKYTDGWEWQFDLTVWSLAETSLKMKFDQWSGASTLAAATNMQFSVDNGASWLDITSNGLYSSQSADLGLIDNSLAAGRQIKILVHMKVPTGTKVGNYTSNYGIFTE